MRGAAAAQVAILTAAAVLAWPSLRGGGPADLAVAATGLVFAGIAVVSLPSHPRYAALSGAAAAAWLLPDVWSQLMWVHRPLVAAAVLSFPLGRLPGPGARAVVGLLAVSSVFPSLARSPHLTVLLAGLLAVYAWTTVGASEPALRGTARARAVAASALALAMVIPPLVGWFGPGPMPSPPPPLPLIVFFLWFDLAPGLELVYAVLVGIAGGILLVRLLAGVEESEADSIVALLEQSPAEVLDALRETVGTAGGAGQRGPIVAAVALLERNIALQAALVDAVEGVRSSRRALVSATEFERRTLRRRLAERALPAVPEMDSHLATVGEVPEDLVQLCRDELRAIGADLDRLADGLHPEALSREGLAGLREVGARCPVPTVVDVPDGRLTSEVEEAAWFAVTEALANAVKYAKAALVRVHIRLHDGFLIGDVTDDGRGGATFEAAGGLLGLRDRLEAVGGHLAVASPPGMGTALRFQVPLP